MEIKQHSTITHGRRRLMRGAASAISSAPWAIGLGAISIATTLTVVISTVSTGRTPSEAPLALISALLLGAVAAVAASRPARGERARRVARSVLRDSDRR